MQQLPLNAIDMIKAISVHACREDTATELFSNFTFLNAVKSYRDKNILSPLFNIFLEMGAIDIPDKVIFHDDQNEPYLVAIYEK